METQSRRKGGIRRIESFRGNRYGYFARAVLKWLHYHAVGSRDITIAAVAEKYKLTGREADMLRYLGRNAGNDVIAAELHLTDVTVRKHIRNLLTKLSIDGRQEVAGWLERFNK